MTRTGANEWLIFVASASLLIASFIALSRDNLKARLAYSTVSQLAYVVLGAALATSTSIVGSGLQIAMHAAGKITLFFCAGAIYTAHHLTEVSQMTGIGRKMPVTMLAFLIASLSIIGLPPLGGTWSKWTLALGALDAGYVDRCRRADAQLTVERRVSVADRGARILSPPPGTPVDGEITVEEAPRACLIALSCTALLCVVLFFLAGQVETLLTGL